MSCGICFCTQQFELKWCFLQILQHSLPVIIGFTCHHLHMLTEFFPIFVNLYLHKTCCQVTCKHNFGCCPKCSSSVCIKCKSFPIMQTQKKYLLYIILTNRHECKDLASVSSFAWIMVAIFRKSEVRQFGLLTIQRIFFNFFFCLLQQIISMKVRKIAKSVGSTQV